MEQLFAIYRGRGRGGVGGGRASPDLVSQEGTGRLVTFTPVYMSSYFCICFLALEFKV